MTRARRILGLAAAWVSRYGLVAVLLLVAIIQAVLGVLDVQKQCSTGCLVAVSGGTALQVPTQVLSSVVLRFGTALLALFIGLAELWQQRRRRAFWAFTSVAAAIGIAGLVALVVLSELSLSNLVEALGWLLVLAGVGSGPVLTGRARFVRIYVALAGTLVVVGVSLYWSVVTPSSWTAIGVALAAIAAVAYLRWLVRWAGSRSTRLDGPEAVLSQQRRFRFWTGLSVAVVGVVVAATGLHVRFPAQLRFDSAGVVGYPGAYGWAMYSPGTPLTLEPGVSELAFQLSHSGGALAITKDVSLVFEDCTPLPVGMFYVRGRAAGMPFFPAGTLIDKRQRPPEACSKADVAGHAVGILFPTGATSPDQQGLLADSYSPARFTFSGSDPVMPFYVLPDHTGIPPTDWPPGHYLARIKVDYFWYDTFGKKRDRTVASSPFWLVKAPAGRPFVTLSSYQKLTDPVPSWFQTLAKEMSSPTLAKQWSDAGSEPSTCADLVNAAIGDGKPTHIVSGCWFSNGPGPF